MPSNRGYRGFATNALMSGYQVRLSAMRIHGSRIGCNSISSPFFLSSAENLSILHEFFIFTTAPLPIPIIMVLSISCPIASPRVYKRVIQKRGYILYAECVYTT